MKNNLIEDFNLPKYLKGKSFADASKSIERKFKDRNDDISLRTKEELLTRLSKAQEYIKMKDAIANNATEVPDMMNGNIPENMNEYFLGGAFTNYDNMEGLENMEQVSDGASALNGVASGAQMGMTFGPWGALIGGAIGGVTGLIGGDKKNAAISKAKKAANLKSTFDSVNEYNNDFKKGGYTNEYGDGTPDLNKIFELNNYNNPLSSTPAVMPKTPNKTSLGKRIAYAGDWLNNNAGNILSYAPIAGNLLQLSKLEKPITARGSRLDNVYDRQLFDTNSLINQINQNDVNSALTESSGGDLGALRSNILAANLNKSKAISDATIKGSQINRDENRFAFQTGLQRDQINARLNEAYIDRKARDEGAYSTTKANFEQALFEDIGKIGQDIVNKKLVKEMYGYTWDGKYYVDANGNKLTKQQMVSKVSNDKMFGRYNKV